MKISIPGARILAGLGLAAGLMIGCTDFLGTGNDTNGTAQTPVEESGTLSLSIKDDSTCREQWGDILSARSAGHADSAAEAAFLASCVKEVRITKDTPKPNIPPALLPDSGTRCKWIATQIEGGRDSLTVSYKKYCPEDCRILATKDSAGHEKLCHVPGDLPPKTRPDDSGVVVKPRDTLIVKPDPSDDTCRMLREKLAMTKPGEPGRAELEKMVLTHCGVIVPPKPDPEADTCKMLMERLAKLDPASEEYLKYKRIWAERCGGVVPPKDTVIIKPPVVNCDELRKKLAGLDPASADYARAAITLKEHCPEKPPVVVDPIPKPIPTPRDSICMDLKLRLSKATTDAQRAELEAAYKAKCLDIVPVKDPPIVVVPIPTPRDSICMDLKLRLSKATTDAQRAELEAAFKAKCMEPVPVKDPPVVAPVVNCDELRKKLAGLDPASADYARVAGSLKEHCPEAPAVK